MREVLFGYLLLINVGAFLLYGADKYKARRGEWRIRESVLLILAGAGGSLGALAAMYMFHHKTRKPRFRLGVPAFLAVHVLAVWYVLGHC